jgi:hypothetical protein
MHHPSPISFPHGEGNNTLTQFQIVGAAGLHRELINGVYESTLQLCGGKTVYRKCENSDIWIEHDVKAGEWNILNTAHRGLSWGYASFKSQNDMKNLEGKAGWKVFDGKSWADQPGVRLKFIPRASPRVAVPEVPKQPPPPPPFASKSTADPSVMRVPSNVSESSTLESRRISPRLVEDSVVRHFDFVDSTRAAEVSPLPNRISEGLQSSAADEDQEASGEEILAKSSSSSLSGAPHATPSSANSRGSREEGSSGSVHSDHSASGSQRVKHRRLHIDALEPGHPLVIMRVSKQQALPVSSLSDRMSDLNLRSVQTAAAIVDEIAAERSCAKLCVWNTPRFSRVSEMVVDVILASGQRMEADGDVTLVREGEDASNAFYFVASGQIKFLRCICCR